MTGRRYQGDVDRRKVCVIGAGLSGLIAIKELLDENHQVVCYEKQSAEGGVFNVHDRVQNTAYDSTLLTISNYAMAFSCFPPKEHEERRFWTLKEYARYLNEFMRFHSLQDYIVFESEVLSIKRWKQTKWLVRVRVDGAESEEVFDAVAVCGGAFQRAKMPPLSIVEGEGATPEMVHSIDYVDARPFMGKRVVCIGVGESGADIVHEIAAVAESCMLSVRPSPPSLIPRFVGPHARFPNDALTTVARYKVGLNQYESVFNRTRFDASWREAVRADHESYEIRLDPAADKYENVERFIEGWNKRSYAGGLFAGGLPFVSRFLTKNTIFVEDVVDGRLQVNFSEIRSVVGSRVCFEDGEEFEADVIVCCTGYEDVGNPLFQEDPFLKELVGGVLNPREWFKHMIHPKIGKGLAFIGFARPTQGLVPACSELQSRYFALLCSNRRHLPEDLERLTRMENEEEERLIQGDARIKVLVQYPYYSDGLADLIGCRPSRWWMLRDPLLAYKLYMGAKVPPVFRLNGPHSNPESSRRVIKRLPLVDPPLVQLVMLLLTFRPVFALVALAGAILAKLRRTPESAAPEPKVR